MSCGTWPGGGKPSLRIERRSTAYRRINVPVLYLSGSASPESAHAVTRALVPALRKVRVVQFQGLGHTAPITYPEIVNAEIERFLAAL